VDGLHRSSSYLVPWSSSLARRRASFFRSAFSVPSGHGAFERLEQLGDGGEDRAVVEAFAEKVAIVENGRRRKITKRCAMIKQLVNKAASGDLRGSRQLTDLEFRLNPEGVRQKSALELLRSLAEASRKAQEAEELENVSDRESEARR
jgi:hypothetical protein